MRCRILSWAGVVITLTLASAVIAMPGCTQSNAAFKAEVEAVGIFNNKCATCHGLAGEGNGPGAANCNPKPRNYTDKAWQQTVSDEMIEKAIVYGGAAVGKSAVMPSNPDLAEKPEVVQALRKKVRSFAGL